jgi:hypothetical protein
MSAIGSVILIIDSPTPLPTRLSHTRNLALQREGAKADSAKTEFAIYRARTPTGITPSITTSGKLGFALRFNY